jgi:hypothetical protein
MTPWTTGVAGGDGHPLHCIAARTRERRAARETGRIRSEIRRNELEASSEMASRDVAARDGESRCDRPVRSLAACASLAVALALGLPPTAHADLVIPPGARYDTGGSRTDLACTDVVVAGTLVVAGGSLVRVRHLTIQPGGAIDGGSGLIQLGGNWGNGGTFAAGTSTIRFTDACGLTSVTVDGNTAFFNARFASATGKNFVFQVGATQSIAGLLEILGTTSNPIQFRSGTRNQVANVNLLSGGTQSTLHVGVTDVWATGQHLAPYQSNEGGGGNAFNWFGPPLGVGDTSTLAVPTLADMALVALAALLAGFAIVDLRRRGRSRAQPTHSRRLPSRDHP